MDWEEYDIWRNQRTMEAFLCEIVRNSKIENTGTCKMKRLENIIQVLDAKMISNENYYNLKDLQKYLNDLSDEMVEVGDHILTPYYIFRGKRMELYEYELAIVADTKQSFEEYLLNLTGRQSISDIPDSIIEREKNCYIECERNTQMIKVSCLREYINFLLSNENIQRQIKECYKIFSADNMFFEIY